MNDHVEYTFPTFVCEALTLIGELKAEGFCASIDMAECEGHPVAHVKIQAIGYQGFEMDTRVGAGGGTWDMQSCIDEIKSYIEMGRKFNHQREQVRDHFMSLSDEMVEAIREFLPDLKHMLPR
jgi:hypothetical protein